MRKVKKYGFNHTAKSLSGHRPCQARSAADDSKGFTLIEIIIVLAIIAILSAIAAPAWFGFISNVRLNQAQDQAYWVMRKAQSNAKRDKMSWDASFREANGTVEWAIYPSSAPTSSLQWQPLGSNIRLDAETTLQRSGSIRRARFDDKGNVSGRLGRLTISNQRGSAKRCVITSTLIGALRKSRDRPEPDSSGRYCY